MYELDNEGIAPAIDYGSYNTEPFYLYITSSTWRMFIKYRHSKCDLESEKRLLKAARTVYKSLTESDRELLQFYGQREGLREESLAAYSYRTGIPRQQIRKRFYYLCYLLAIQLHLINGLTWIPPQQ